MRFQLRRPFLTRFRIMNNTQRYERWNTGLIPVGGSTYLDYF